MGGSVLDLPENVCIKQAKPLFYVFDLVPQHFGYHMYVIRLKTYIKLQSNCDRSASIQYDRLIQQRAPE